MGVQSEAKGVPFYFGCASESKIDRAAIKGACYSLRLHVARRKGFPFYHLLGKQKDINLKPRTRFAYTPLPPDSTSGR